MPSRLVFLGEKGHACFPRSPGKLSAGSANTIVHRRARPSSYVALVAGTVSGRAGGPLHLYDVFFFVRAQLTDLRDKLVGQLLHFVLTPLAIIFGNELFLLEFLQVAIG